MLNQAEEIVPIQSDPTEDDLTIEDNGNLSTRPHLLRKIIATGNAGLSTIAVLPVPYLVLRSVYYLFTRKEQFSFADMIHSGSPTFWIVGSSISGLATIAIAPFNFYNTYKVTISCGCGTGCGLCSSILRYLSGALFITSGSVNGYNMNAAVTDIFGDKSISSYLVRYPTVSICVFYAGLSDSRVSLTYLQSDTLRDIRNVKRMTQYGFNQITRRCGFFQRQQLKLNCFGLSRQQLLWAIREKLDDLQYIILLGLDDQEVKLYYKQHLPTIESLEFDSAELEAYLELLGKGFPYVRFAFSEVLGTLFSGLWAYYGNQNVLYYAYQAFILFFGIFGLSEKNLAIKLISSFASYIGYGIGLLVSFYLIRDLFFRDIAKNVSLKTIAKNFAKVILPLVPAFSFGLLNIIMTVMNDDLSPITKVIVALSALIGATVVSRYGIQGGVEEFLGRRNERRALSGYADTIMQLLQPLEYDEIYQFYSRINTIVDRVAREDEVPETESAVEHGTESYHRL